MSSPPPRVSVLRRARGSSSLSKRTGLVFLLLWSVSAAARPLLGIDDLIDEFRQVQHLAEPQQLIVGTWLPRGRLSEFLFNLAHCCVHQPQFFGDSRFLCITSNLECLGKLPTRTSVTRFKAEWKFDSDMLTMPADGPVQIQVHTITRTRCREVADHEICRCSDDSIHIQLSQFHIVTCSSLAGVHLLASNSVVGYIEPTSPRRIQFSSKGASWIVQRGGDSPAPFIPLPGVASEFVISQNGTRPFLISLADGAPRLDHQLFARSNVFVVPTIGQLEPSFHGTHLAAVIAGSPEPGSMLAAYSGISPGVALAVVETDPGDLIVRGPNEIWKAAANFGSAVHVDPWGTLPSLTSRESLWYTAAAYEVDEFFWRHRSMLNIRPLGVPSALQGSFQFAEVASKNALIVGSSMTNSIDMIEQHAMFFPPVFAGQCLLYGICNTSISGSEFCRSFEHRVDELMPHDRWFCLYSTDIAALAERSDSGSVDLLFSGLYLTDGRIRPHMVLPGTGVVSGFPGSTTSIGVLSGTSVSAAVAGGMTALMYNFMLNGYHWPELTRSQDSANIPLASLLRALMLAGSRIMQADATRSSSLSTLPENPGLSRTKSGYGRPQLDLLLPQTDEFSLVVLANENVHSDLSSPTMGSDFHRWCYRVNRVDGLVSVALTWPDPPAAYPQSATMLNLYKLTVRETSVDVEIVDTVQSGNEQVLSFVPASQDLEIRVETVQLVHNGSFSLVIVTSPGIVAVESICQVCTPGAKSSCAVRSGTGQAICSAAGVPGVCRVESCETGYVPTASTASCRTLPSMFILTTAMTAFVVLVLIALLVLLVGAAWLQRLEPKLRRLSLLRLLEFSVILFGLIVVGAALSSLAVSYASFLTSSAMDKSVALTAPLSDYTALLIGVICASLAQIALAAGLSATQGLLNAIGTSRLRILIARTYVEQDILEVVAGADRMTGEILVPSASAMGRMSAITLQATTALSRLGIGAIILFSLTWKLALAAVGCVVVMAVQGALTSSLSRVSGRYGNSKSIYFHAFNVANVGLIDWLKVNYIRFRVLYRKPLRNMQIGVSYMQLVNQMSLQLGAGIVELTAIAVFCAALRALQLGELTFGLLVVFFSWFSQFVNAFQALIGVWNIWGSFSADSMPLLSHLNEPARRRGSVELSTTEELAAENISFHYPNSSVGFERISLALLTRKLSLLMGPSGVGKSSLLRILTGLIAPDQGRVLLGGFNLNEVQELSIFENMTLIEQDVMLKIGTIQSNVCVGVNSNDVPESTLSLALEIGALSWISAAPLGWMTPVTSGGTTLSGGQRKLIGILRAFARGTRILLADEVTSGLDPVRCIKVMNALRSASKTILLTSHQPELVPFANVVYSLSPTSVSVWTQETAEKRADFGLAAARQRTLGS